jgi:TonB family protein
VKQFLLFAVCSVSALSGTLSAAAQDAPAQAPANAEAMRTGAVLAKLSPPVYPPLARQANISGEVRVDLSIRQDGTVAAADAFSGHPMLKQSAVESARQSHFECRNCVVGLTNFSLTYAFEMKDDGDCCSAFSRTPEITESSNRISIVAPHWCLCDPTSTITRIKWRSAKCLYLWHCASRVTDTTE